jgi:predicted permease
MLLEILQQIVTLFIHQILPLMLLVGLGFALMRWYRFDIGTMNCLNLYVFLPAFFISRILSMEFSVSAGWQIAGIYTLQIVLLFALSLSFAAWRGYKRSVKATFCLSSSWGNTGNLGLPLIELALGAGAVAYQLILVAINAVTLFTMGLTMIAAGKYSLRQALVSVAKQPIIHALLAATLMRVFDWHLPGPLAVPVDYLAEAMIPVAIITLGCQLAEVKPGHGAVPGLWPSIMMRLLAAPALMFLLVWLFGVTGIMAKVLVIGSSVPVAVNSAILAIEYKNEPALAARAVFWSTITCILTLSVVIYLANLLF